MLVHAEAVPLGDAVDDVDARAEALRLSAADGAAELEGEAMSLLDVSEVRDAEGNAVDDVDALRTLVAREVAVSETAGDTDDATDSVSGAEPVTEAGGVAVVVAVT